MSLTHLEGVVSGPRPGRMRDRRGRGARGPLALPGPLSPDSVPAHLTPRQDFDALVDRILTAMSKHLDAEPDQVEVVVEEAPLLPPSWSEPVPTSAMVRTGDSSRVILYRLPLTKRCDSAVEVEQSTWQAVIDRLAEVWEVSPGDIDPR
jgi:hypothetical protein